MVGLLTTVKLALTGMLLYFLYGKIVDIESGWRFYLNSKWKTSRDNVIKDGLMALWIIICLIVAWFVF